MLVAGKGSVSARTLGWIVVCAVSARTVAMCFNRLMDWTLDKLNPRTSERHTLVSKTQAWSALFLAAAVAFWAAFQLNALCLALFPVMLFILCFYSLTKRFTAFSHFFLGLALAVAPAGAWVGVRASLSSPEPFLLGLAVLVWTFGFDLIYSTLDTEFDRTHGLFSFPARYGVPAALKLAKALHGAAAACFFLFGLTAGLGIGYACACLLTLGALVWEHRLAASLHPAQINKAFFQINAFVSMTLLAGTIFDLKAWKFLAF
jgi:4-hydroxybenzoate polyprenyltransferase